MKLKSILFLISIGNKNLWRRKSRTLLLGFSFMVLTFLIVLFLGYSEGISRQMIGKAVDNFLGDLVITSNQAQMNALSLEKTESFDVNEVDIYHDPKISAKVEFWRQYRTMAFFYTDNLQRVGMLTGIEAKNKKRFKIVRGENLSFTGLRDNEVLISKAMAENLRVDINDQVAIEVVTPQGIRNFDYFFVKGIYQIPGTAEIMVSHIIFTALEDLQLLMNEPDTKVTELLVYQKNRNHISRLVSQMKKHFQNSAFKVMDYREYGSMLIAIMGIFVIMVWLIGVIAIFIISIFFFDTMLATVEERKREYGTMICMGLGKEVTGGIVLSEFALFSINFVLPGIILGGIFVKLIERVGLPVSGTISDFMGGVDILTPYFKLSTLVWLFLAIFLLIELANLYSIHKINRLNPIEVLKNE